MRGRRAHMAAPMSYHRGRGCANSNHPPSSNPWTASWRLARWPLYLAEASEMNHRQPQVPLLLAGHRALWRVSVGKQGPGSTSPERAGYCSSFSNAIVALFFFSFSILLCKPTLAVTFLWAGLVRRLFSLFFLSSFLRVYSAWLRLSFVSPSLSLSLVEDRDTHSHALKTLYDSSYNVHLSLSLSLIIVPSIFPQIHTYTPRITITSSAADVCTRPVHFRSNIIRRPASASRRHEHHITRTQRPQPALPAGRG